MACVRFQLTRKIHCELLLTLIHTFTIITYFTAREFGTEQVRVSESNCSVVSDFKSSLRIERGILPSFTTVSPPSGSSYRARYVPFSSTWKVRQVRSSRQAP